jgi:hypothetical protein
VLRRLALAAALALAGCPPRAPPPDLSLDPAELLVQVRAAQERIRTVRGEARVRVEGPGGSGTVPTFAAAKRPDRVFVQTLDFFGNTVSTLATAAGELSLYDARERVLYRGPATPENLGRLVPVPLAPADLAVILCGTAPLLDGAPVRAEPGRGFVTLELAAGDRRQTLRVGPGAAIEASSVAVPPGEHGGYALAFRAFDTWGSARFPAEIELSTEDPRARLRLTWTDAEPGVDLDDRLFSPGTPRGARIVDLAGAPPPAALFPEPRPDAQPGPRSPGD